MFYIEVRLQYDQKKKSLIISFFFFFLISSFQEDVCGNHRVQHEELGDGLQQEPLKRELLPKPPLSLGGRTPMRHRGCCCTWVWCTSVYSGRSRGIKLGNGTLNYYLFLCAGHIIVWCKVHFNSVFLMLSDYLKSVQSGVCMLCRLSHKLSYK